MEQADLAGILGLPGEAVSSICLWIPELLARKNSIYAPRHSCRPGHFGYPFIATTDAARTDREIISWLWTDSEQLPLPALPLEVACITYRGPTDTTGDVDHWVSVILDHATKAGCWPDDKWIDRALVIRAEAARDEDVGTYLIGWTKGAECE